MSRARATRKWHLRLCKRLRIRPGVTANFGKTGYRASASVVAGDISDLCRHVRTRIVLGPQSETARHAQLRQPLPRRGRFGAPLRESRAVPESRWARDRLPPLNYRIAAWPQCRQREHRDVLAFRDAEAPVARLHPTTWSLIARVKCRRA